MKKFFLLILCAFCLTSCFFSHSNNRILYCDFGKPEKIFSTHLKIGKISQAQYIGKKFLIREKDRAFSKSGTKLLLGEPNNLVSTYLKLAFLPGNQNSCEISANILSLEFTKTDKVALFVAEYMLTKLDKTTSFMFSSAVTDSANTTSSEKSLEEIMNSFVNEINQKISELE